ncbi:MAG: hypothetical protein ACRERE_37770, partial [Candidatus Entotheonellia bacterium]
LRQGPCAGERSHRTRLDSGVRRQAPAPLEAGERLQRPTYRYPLLPLAELVFSTTEVPYARGT